MFGEGGSAPSFTPNADAEHFEGLFLLTTKILDPPEVENNILCQLTIRRPVLRSFSESGSSQECRRIYARRDTQILTTQEKDSILITLLDILVSYFMGLRKKIRNRKKASEKIRRVKIAQARSKRVKKASEKGAGK